MSNVYANRTLAGALGRQGEFNRFDYAKTAGINETVALAMPVDSPDGFVTKEARSLHPVFAMNLPEGALRRALQAMFAKALSSMDDMALLEIVGRSQIGRIRVAPSVEELDGVPSLSLSSLLKTQGTEKMFDELLTRYAQYSGIAGVQPKILVRDEDSLFEGPAATGKITVSGATHIVKFFDPVEFPALAANEFACLSAARAAGLPTPAFWLANDGRCLAVERFDITPGGAYLAVEDACSLAGYQPDDKYAGSYEQVAKVLGSAISPRHTNEDLALYFRSFVLSIIVRNGDAHRKNFSVLYSNPSDARLSPVYDIVSTTPYIKNDAIALTLTGSKRWPGRKKLIQFGVNSCNLTPGGANDAIEQICSAVHQTRELLSALRESAGDERSADALASMLAAWDDGLLQAGRRPDSTTTIGPLPGGQ